MARKSPVKAARNGAQELLRPGADLRFTGRKSADSALPALIRGKTEVPALPDHFVGRPRLKMLLIDAISRDGVVVLAAAAGSGKTTSVVEACGSDARRVAWLTVDRPDKAAGRLLTYLEAALWGCVAKSPRVARDALAAGAPHLEAAGLLAEAIDDVPTVLVLDELERLDADREAWSVIEALVRYAPDRMSVVLISREDPPAEIMSLGHRGALVVVDETTLAFTPAEAEQAFIKRGRSKAASAIAVASAGGWVTGVLFADPASPALDGVPRDLHDYVAAHVIGRLRAEQQEFLTTTSVLDQITTPRAAALGYPDAAARLSAIRRQHLPGVWSADGKAMTCHSAVREYLLDRLHQRPAEELHTVRIRYARLLAEEGHHEEAVEEFLKADAADAAVISAGHAITSVVQRLDFDVAERWLSALAEHHTPALTVGRLLMAVARDDISRAVSIADEAREQLRLVPESAERESAAYLMAWSYFHHARWDDINAVLHDITTAPVADTVRLGMRVLGAPGDDGEAIGTPAAINGPAEAMINIGKYGHGQLTALTEMSDVGWDASTRTPWTIAALRALGRTREALRAYRTAESTCVSRVALLTVAGADVLIDAGEHEEAEAVITEGKRLAAASGSLIFQGAARLPEAKFMLRVKADPVGALTVLNAPELRRAAEQFGRMREIAAMWRGLAYLFEHRDAKALEELRTAVDSMVTSDRILELPTAATYLAEAEWRAGNEEAFDRMADLALDAARRQGSNHLLVQALDDVPGVLPRRLDAELDAASAWHVLGRARIARPPSGVAPGAASIVLREFGSRELFVGGEPVKMPIGKSYELLAYLLTRPREPVARQTLLSVLFDDRQDTSTRSYLRQSIRWLKTALPDEALVLETETVMLSNDVQFLSDATSIERGLADAAVLQGDERLDATLAAIAPQERGPFLPGVRAEWADQRERELLALVTEARAQAAELAVSTGRLPLAIKLARLVLVEDPARESAWQTIMRVTEASGDQDGLRRTYRECEAALAEWGSLPSPSTQRLFQRLRR
jgi:ATP/maltotriose-dependent transcriptional regulator MalT/DNA-binding SARP family transcriptional activator